MFHVGQEVVCINDDDPKWVHLHDPVLGRRGIFPFKKGLKYTISEINAVNCSCHCDIGLGIAQDDTYTWCSRRFRPVIKRKTDISTFTEILRSAKPLADA
jgi:hypothetical protein